MLNLKNKKVTVMGLGLYEGGSGISAVKFLLNAGAKITVTDLKTKKQLKDQIKRIESFLPLAKGLRSKGQKRGIERPTNATLGAFVADPGTVRRGSKTKPSPTLPFVKGGRNAIRFVLGEHKEGDFKNADLIIKNPGVPAKSKYLKIAKDNKIPIATDISLFFQLCDRKRIIGVTGTRGKSTTATLIYELLKTADKNAVLGGNITQSPLAQMPQVEKGGPVVLELSSWMLEGLGDIKKSPHIAVFTNVYPDHLNTYDGLADYIKAKTNIFKFQNPQDYLVISRDNPKTFLVAKRAPSQRYWFSKKYFKEENGSFVRNNFIYFRRDGIEHKICSIKNVVLAGEHNLENILAAVCAAEIYGVKPLAIKKVLKSFKGIPNRLELLREVGGIKYYNDTTSTTPEATIAGLKTLGKKKNIILIAGGTDKGLDFTDLVKEIKKHCKAVILLNGTGTEKLRKKLSVSGQRSAVSEVSSMEDAILVARKLAHHGDIILLSPACTSFGMFNNEFDRGDQFKSIVRKLK